MLSLKLLIVVFTFCVALSCVAASKKTKKSNRPRRLRFRTFGTGSPDESGFCYRNVYYDRRGKNELGDYLDCVTSAPVFNPVDFTTTFNVTTTFASFDPDEDTIVTSCFVTVTPDADIGPEFNAREACKNRNGVLLPEGRRGSVRLNGLVNNTLLPQLTFDLRWTIKIR